MEDLRCTELLHSECPPCMATVVFPGLVILEYKICFIFLGSGSDIAVLLAKGSNPVLWEWGDVAQGF